MRYLRSFVKYLLIFILGVVVAAFVSLTAVSYYGVEHLTQAKPIEKKSEKKPEKRHDKKKTVVVDEDVPPEDTLINSNILDVLRLGDQYTSELNGFDELQSKIAAHKSPPLCDVICNPSNFDRDRMLEERTPYLKSFYQENGERALKDPYFQLKLREIGFLSDIFPSSFRRIWMDVEQKRNEPLTVSQKISWSLRFEFAALKEASRLRDRWEDLKKESDRIQAFRDLIQSCQKGLRPAKDLRSDCQRL
jgi:hypothetical protein